MHERTVATPQALQTTATLIPSSYMAKKSPTLLVTLTAFENPSWNLYTAWPALRAFFATGTGTASPCDPAWFSSTPTATGTAALGTITRPKKSVAAFVGGATALAGLLRAEEAGDQQR